MANEPQHVITDNPNVVPTGRDLALEAAATLAALLDVRKERTLANQQFTVRRKKLEKRAEELIDEIRTGPNNQLKLHFGSAVALVTSAPDDEDENFEQDETEFGETDQDDPRDVDEPEEDIPADFDDELTPQEALH